jgi:AhpC/TSA family protein
MSAVVMYENRTVEVRDVMQDGEHLWLGPADLAAATGWTVKPEGLCREEACVPLPRDGSWTDAEGRVDLAAFAERQRRPVVRDEEHSIWAFGDSVNARVEELESGMAADFTLPDLDGNLHSLSDFRGRKVLLMSWGSYCGCRFDLYVWQVLYDELKDRDFEIVSVALDAGGSAAVGPTIRGDGLDELPDVLASLMGWTEEQWAGKGAPQYTCLIDEEHVISDLYNITNVPQAVWIDEDGRIVRPTEPAGASDNHRQLDHETFDLPDEEVERLRSNRALYWNAVRDWVAKGDDSEFALSPEEVGARRHRPGEEDVRAALHARIGHHLLTQGESDAARRQFEAAVELVPLKWNYRRQSMVLAPEMIGELNAGEDFFDATAAIGNNAYYDTIDMPGIRQDPLVSGPPGAPPS